MEVKIRELIKVLNEELKAYQAMLKFSKEKGEAIKDKNLDSVAKLTAEEEIVLKEILTLEKKRIGILQELLKEEITEDSQINVSKILEKVSDESLKNELNKIKEDLKNTIEELKIVNTANEKMIKDTLEIINYSFKLISKVTGEAATYSKDKIKGKDSKSSLSQQSMIFDKKF